MPPKFLHATPLLRLNTGTDSRKRQDRTTLIDFNRRREERERKERKEMRKNQGTLESVPLPRENSLSMVLTTFTSVYKNE